MFKVIGETKMTIGWNLIRAGMKLHGIGFAREYSLHNLATMYTDQMKARLERTPFADNEHVLKCFMYIAGDLITAGLGLTQGFVEWKEAKKDYRASRDNLGRYVAILERAAKIDGKPPIELQLKGHKSYEHYLGEAEQELERRVA